MDIKNELTTLAELSVKAAKHNMPGVALEYAETALTLSKAVEIHNRYSIAEKKIQETTVRQT